MTYYSRTTDSETILILLANQNLRMGSHYRTPHLLQLAMETEQIAAQFEKLLKLLAATVVLSPAIVLQRSVTEVAMVLQRSVRTAAATVMANLRLAPTVAMEISRSAVLSERRQKRTCLELVVAQLFRSKDLLAK